MNFEEYKLHQQSLEYTRDAMLDAGMGDPAVINKNFQQAMTKLSMEFQASLPPAPKYKGPPICKPGEDLGLYGAQNVGWDSNPHSQYSDWSNQSHDA